MHSDQAHRPAGRPRTASPACCLLLLWAALGAGGVVSSGQAPERPHLRRQGSATQLIVDGRPFLIRGGELGNSSASSLEYLAPSWATFRDLRLNTVLAPVYWDLVEPEEGRFDFALVDGLVAEARKNDLRLVLLWFGSWKNSMSCYAPAWVKKDQARFPRSVDASGRSVEILSPFSDANRDADARAFAALMKRLKDSDDDRHTVVMVQVENEIGMIGFSPFAIESASASCTPPSSARHHRRSRKAPSSIPPVARRRRRGPPAGSSSPRRRTSSCLRGSA